jgi:parallel beta-helix repeat protein
MCISESDGIWILKSKNNLFQNNNLSKNLLHGITIDYQSNNNIIKNNYITENRWVGVMIEWYSQRNLITNNIFMNNKAYNGYHIQAFENYWNSNYWDDWIGLKSPFFSFLPKIIYGSPSEENPRIRLPLAIDLSPLNES